MMTLLLAAQRSNALAGVLASRDDAAAQLTLQALFKAVRSANPGAIPGLRKVRVSPVFTTKSVPYFVFICSKCKQ